MAYRSQAKRGIICKIMRQSGGPDESECRTRQVEGRGARDEFIAMGTSEADLTARPRRAKFERACVTALPKCQRANPILPIYLI